MKHVDYEWSVEVTDTDDIVDVAFYATAAEARAAVAGLVLQPDEAVNVALVRSVWDRYGSMTDRTWAYIDPKGLLPERFATASGEPAEVVPQRFRTAWAKTHAASR